MPTTNLIIFEPLHDCCGHIKNLITELPFHIPTDAKEKVDNIINISLDEIITYASLSDTPIYKNGLDEPVDTPSIVNVITNGNVAPTRICRKKPFLLNLILRI